MASTNQSPFYKKAEANFLSAQTDEERLHWLEEMIRECPKHKSSEAMLANLKTRSIKLREKIENIKKKKTGSKEGIKKADMQVIIIGLTNSGKSSLLSRITNAQPTISQNNSQRFTTRYPEIGTMNYENVKIQIIDEPAIESEYFDYGLIHTTDVILETITNLEDLKKIEPLIEKTNAKKIVVFNKSDLLDEQQKRKINANLSSKKYNFVIISTKNNECIEELKNKIFNSFNICRIYLKEPYKEPSKIPMILKPNSTVLDVANKISKELAKSIKEVHIWGPSSKFPNQKVGLLHVIKDKDIIEFKTR
ncbi:MAG TPA: 50S ribosome-binding GTPase [Candidatus Paceibacterota bacterium]|nr:50S ribosome-binding GTPase [Candidatus Paceibacterota bacterium]